MSLFRSFPFLFSSSPLPAAGSAFHGSQRGFAHVRIELRLAKTTVFARPYASKGKKKMAPKKEVKQEKVMLGRPGNNLKSGIVCTTTAPAMCVLRALSTTMVMLTPFDRSV